MARLLNKLLAQQTKSRLRHPNDNALAETKNGAVIRKQMGYGRIRSVHAEAITAFYREHFNPYLNFDRPCGVPENDNGPQRQAARAYRSYATPWEIAVTSGCGALSETRHYHRATASDSKRRLRSKEDGVRPTAVEKWKTKNSFPSFPLVVLCIKNELRKEVRRQVATLLRSGSSGD